MTLKNFFLAEAVALFLLDPLKDFLNEPGAKFKGAI